MLAAASIAGSFFGAKTSHGSLGTWGVVAMVSFALCVGSAIWVLLPHAFVFAFRGKTLLAESDHRGVSNVVEAYRAAGIWVEPHLEANRRKIVSLSDCLAASCALLAAEVILWTFSLIGYAEIVASKNNPQPPSPQAPLEPRPPAQLPVKAPPGFALPEKRGGLLGGKQ